MKKKKGSILVGVIVVVLIIVGIASLSGGNKDKETTANTTTTTQAKDKDKSYGVNEPASEKDVTVTLVSIKEIKSKNQFIKPDEGKVFVAAEFIIENNSSSELAISSMMSFDAYADGFTTQMDFSATTAAEAQSLDGSVAVGKKMQGAICYQLPSDWKSLEINFQAQAITGKKINFKYSK